MPARPPETSFYDNPQTAILWRDLSRLYEDFAGVYEDAWPKRQETFKTVIRDVLSQLEEAE